MDEKNDLNLPSNMVHGVVKEKLNSLSEEEATVIISKEKDISPKNMEIASNNLIVAPNNSKNIENSIEIERSGKHIELQADSSNKLHGQDQDVKINSVHDNEIKKKIEDENVNKIGNENKIENKNKNEENSIIVSIVIEKFVLKLFSETVEMIVKDIKK